MLDSLKALINSREPFPVGSLLTLYATAHRPLYLNYFEGFKELQSWLAPITRSEFEILQLPQYFYTYEILELSKILNEHPSKIYQELMHIHYAKEYNHEHNH